MTTLHYQDTGKGQVIVLVHAGIADSRMWDAQEAAFARDHRVIRYDVAGFGKSPIVDDTPAREDLRRLLAHLGVERAVLVGCSMGGEIVLDFALEHPEQVAALVLVSTAPGGFEMQGEPPTQIPLIIEALQAGDLARVAELQNQMSVDGPQRTPERVDGEMRRRVAEMNLTALANGALQHAALAPLDPPAATRLSAIQCPTLIIAGGLDHPELLRAAEVMAAQLPKAHKAIIAEAAHLPGMERPAAFNDLVLAFLRENGL
jgi:pimeloyl-ACP methyl ester carboxylesterase